MEHLEDFELEKEYERIWDDIRYKKIEEIYVLSEEVINILAKHIGDALLFHEDYQKIHSLFTKMKQKNFFYTSKSAKELAVRINPKFESVYHNRVCVRELEYLGSDCAIHDGMQKGKKYTSTHFNGVMYTIELDGVSKSIGHSFFKRLS